MRVRSPPRAYHELRGFPHGSAKMSAATAMKFSPRRIERVLLIMNPASRRAARIVGRTLKAFADADVSCDTMPTEAPGHAAILAKTHAHKYDAVFTLGGDGTVME